MRVHLLCCAIRKSILAGAVLTFCSSAFADAEAAKFSRHTLSVIPAQKAFVLPTASSFQLGQHLALDVGPSQEAQELFDRGFQVRIFRLPRGKTAPDFLAYFVPCHVYLSTIVRFVGHGAVQASIANFNDRGWLTVSTDGALSDAEYLLVVERNGGGDPLLRLDDRRKDAYFKSGFLFRVTGTGRLNDGQNTTFQRASEKFWADVVLAAKKNAPDLQCFTMQASYANDRDELLAYMKPPCSPDVAEVGTN